MPTRTILLALLASIVSALFLIAASPEERATVRLTIVGPPAAAVAVTVTVRVPRDAGPETVRRFDATAPGSISLPVPAEDSWVTEVSAPGYWSAPRTIEKQHARVPLEFDLWRASEVRGALSVPKGTDVPHTISLRLQSQDAELQARLGPTTLACPVDESGAFRCAVPKLRQADLRFRVPGFASRFFWDVNLTTIERLDVGKLALRRGATVVGRVAAEASVGLQEIEVELSPARRSPYPTTTDGAEIIRVHSDRQGFFSLEGLDPGVYWLVARHPELADAEIAPVRVVEGAQTEIEAPIVLAAAQPIRIAVEPLFDAHQEDWRVKISRSLSPGQLSGSPVVTATTVAGFLKTDGIALGTYEVEILDSSDQRMLTTRIAHTENTGIHTLVIKAVQLEGEVTLGGEPLLARLQFRRLTARRSTESDLDGRFGTQLPEEGVWDVEVTSRMEGVSWRRRDIEIVAKDGLATVRLELPDTRIGGTVVDEDGELQSDATVTAENLARSRAPISRTSDDEGAFQFRGLDEDEYHIVASLGEAFSSDAERVQVVEGSEPSVRLVLRPNRILKGRFVDPGGSALPGTWLLTAAFTEAYVLDSLRDDIGSTDANGAFRLSLRSSTAHVGVMAFVPGIGTRSARLQPGDAGDLMVGPESGTVQLVFDEPLVLDRARPLPVLVTPGQFRVNLGALVQWAGLNGAAIVEPETATSFTIPLLEPGPYQLCWMTMADLSSGLSPGIACATAHLGAGEVLTLRLASVAGD